MTNDQIIATLQKWQQDGMTKSRGVFVSYYRLQPHAETLSELFDKAVTLIEQKKNELRKALDE